MLQFETKDATIEIDRGAFETIARNELLKQVDLMRQEKSGMYQLIKQSLSMASMVGVEFPFEIPKGVNPIEFIICWGLEQGLNLIDNKPIPVQANVYPKPEKPFEGVDAHVSD